VFLGMLVALSSTAIVLKLLSERGEMDSPQGQTALAILIFQDLCIVPMTLLTPFLAGESPELADVAMVVGKAVFIVVMALVAARLLVPFVLRQIVATRNREVFLLSIVLLCLGTAWVTAQVGLSLALGAFLAGLVISESEYSHEALGVILPFRDAFIGIFFVSIGMLVDAGTLLHSSWATGAGVAALIVLKAVVAAGAVWILGYSARVALQAGMGLAQVGEFSFVLATAGMAAGVLTEQLFQLFVGAAVITMAATPLFWSLSGAMLKRWGSRLPAGRGAYREAPIAPDAEGDLRDHVIIVGYGINGRNLARVMEGVQIPFNVVEMNPETVRVERRKGLRIFYGDASNREVLKRAGIGRARVLVLAISDPVVSRYATDLARRMNPALHVIVRTRYVREMESLFALGASEVIPEEFETSIEIFSRVLRTYLVPRDVVDRYVREIRQDSYDMFRSLRDRHRPVDYIRNFVRGVELEIYRVEEGSPLAGRSLAEADLRQKTGATVVAVQSDAHLLPNPRPDTAFAVGDVVLLLGTPEQLTKAGGLFAAGK
ncbi:MAG: cation:proton antiporter, partial [Acidobacteria bacterium]|nr:cation:proton antiporter [Acidobacteriota bacterium]